jgi:hypothetical protein
MDIELYALLNRTFGFTTDKQLKKNINDIVKTFKTDIYNYIKLTGGRSFGYKDFIFYDAEKIIQGTVNNSYNYIIGDYYYNGQYIYIIGNKYCNEYYLYNGILDNNFKITDLNNIGTTFNSLYILFDTIINKKVKERDFYS